MADFNEPWDYLLFMSAVRHGFRFFRNAKTDAFIAAVLATCSSRLVSLSNGTTVWRAQLGMADPTADTEKNGAVSVAFAPLNSARMKPRVHAAKEGRANPTGVPCLYCATDPDTAMAEVRPNLASDISLAKLEMTREVTLVDCSKNISTESEFSYLERQIRPPSDERERVVWGSIDSAFTMPIDPSDDAAHYAPTQILAECFKYAGYHGIQYRSGYDTGGHNIALFNLGDAEVRDVKLMRLRSIQMKFEDW
jgi:RES domain